MPMDGFISPCRTTLLLISNGLKNFFWLCLANKIFFYREASARVRLLAWAVADSFRFANFTELIL